MWLSNRQATGKTACEDLPPRSVPVHRNWDKDWGQTGVTPDFPDLLNFQEQPALTTRLLFCHLTAS